MIFQWIATSWCWVFQSSVNVDWFWLPWAREHLIMKKYSQCHQICRQFEHLLCCDTLLREYWINWRLSFIKNVLLISFIYQKCTRNIHRAFLNPHPWISLSLYSLEACWEFITARHENKKILRWRKMAKRSCCSFSIWTWTPIPLISLKCNKCTKNDDGKKNNEG